VFHHGQELDVREAHLDDVVRELVGQLAIVEEAIALLGHTPPRTEMHLVDRQRLAKRLASSPLGEPGLVTPPEVVEIRHDRRRARRLRFEGERIGVRFQCERLRVAAADLELVTLVLPQTRHEDLPDAVGWMKPHRMTPAVPVIEISDHAHAPRARRPHREGHAGHAVEGGRVRAELVVGVVVCALGQQMPIEIAQQRRETVGVVDLGDVAVPRHLEPIGKQVGPVRQHGLEEPHGMEPLHRGRWCVGGHDADGGRAWQDRAHRHGRAVRCLHTVRSEHGEGVTMPTFDDLADHVRIQRHAWYGAGSPVSIL
jgi:hypothetical protein